MVSSIKLIIRLNGIESSCEVSGVPYDIGHVGLVCRKLVDADGSLWHSLNGNLGMILALALTSGDVSKLADKTPSSWISNAGKLACVDTDLTSAILLTPYVNLQHSRTWNVNYGIVC